MLKGVGIMYSQMLLRLFALTFAFTLANIAAAADDDMPHEHSMHHKMMDDDRISLGLSPQMKQHQLAKCVLTCKRCRPLWA